MRMNKQSLITMTAILLCFVILLSLGLHFTATPSVKDTVKAFEKLGYSHGESKLESFIAHSFSKDGESIMIVWYKNKSLATKALSTVSKIGMNATMRGNAVAIGSQIALDIFENI